MENYVNKLLKHFTSQEVDEICSINSWCSIGVNAWTFSNPTLLFLQADWLMKHKGQYKVKEHSFNGEVQGVVVYTKIDRSELPKSSAFNPTSMYYDYCDLELDGFDELPDWYVDDLKAVLALFK